METATVDLESKSRRETQGGSIVGLEIVMDVSEGGCAAFWWVWIDGSNFQTRFLVFFFFFTLQYVCVYVCIASSRGLTGLQQSHHDGGKRRRVNTEDGFYLQCWVFALEPEPERYEPSNVAPSDSSAMISWQRRVVICDCQLTTCLFQCTQATQIRMHLLGPARRARAIRYVRSARYA